MPDLKARETIYRGVSMRSRNEARYAAAIDALELEWEYEPVCYADGRVQYLPDFRVDLEAGPLFVEVKPRPPRVTALLTRMRAVRASVGDATLAVACPQWRGLMVLDRVPHLTEVATWARWSKGAKESFGTFGLGSLGMSGDLLEVGVSHLEGQRHDLGGGDFIEVQPFGWSWEEPEA